jgi:hypothetical protein
MSQHTSNENIIRVITLYDKLNLDKDKIQNGVSIVFDMDHSKFYLSFKDKNSFFVWRIKTRHTVVLYKYKKGLMTYREG